MLGRAGAAAESEQTAGRRGLCEERGALRNIADEAVGEEEDVVEARARPAAVGHERLQR